MKELDRLGKLENRLWKIWGYLAVLVLPMFAWWAVDKVWLHDAPWLVRYPILAIIWIAVFLIGMAFGWAMEGTFKGLRRLLRMWPLVEAQRELDDARLDHDVKTLERHRRWIVEMSDSEYRYRIFEMHEEQTKRTRKTGEQVEQIYWAAIGAIVVSVALKVFVSN